jgi:hypothetical protein
MSSLQRYKKPGGFVQLLSLMETFGPQKKEKFLEMIEQENQVWAKALREKMLTLERIFSWNDQVVIEVFKTLPAKNMALALRGLKEEQRNRLLVFFSASEKRKIEDALLEAQPKPEEIASNMVKVIELTRKMIVSGDLRPERFDEGLVIPEDYEVKLDHGSLVHTASKAAAEPAEVYHNGVVQEQPNGNGNGQGTSAHPPPATLEVAQLQRTLAAYVKENKALKEELRVLREKLDQIKRIA